ncbi:hypothetical protein BN7_3549 [Wickerhamomyces ciferrii]|uniref:Uncharacterized protein n=1 Tax=Wickerhamomyces ciferrii (strain ATCC 14091 / BCRC 22168 / CBS 111 / JCM 3599 / NBRC 0793 / NRRL Y-1031 F-60-10) TaxID=1206466 RepID=K0KFR4_WICCF|nr:uncharacterized protein BN7_3549 [Wickerhamomyces ciferrii]CCH43995.1 hypothetical protein BN7_3549 [Wickerhamomyces ciferrii]
MLSIEPKPSTLKAYPENPWSISTSNFKLKSTSEKHRMPIKLFSFMFTKERSNPLKLTSSDDHFLNSFYYFRPAIINSINSDSDLRQFLIDSLTKILLDYCAKKKKLEISNVAQNIPVNYSDGTSDYKYYGFKANNTPILSHKSFLKDYKDLKFCLVYKPNREPLVPMLENLINILTFGGDLKEIDGFLNFFESESHTASIITRYQITKHNNDISDVNSKYSKIFNKGIVDISNYIIKINGEEHLFSAAGELINFIPGRSTYDLGNLSPPSYQE